MNLVFAVANGDENDAPVLVHGVKVENNTRWAARVANYGQKPSGVWVPWPISEDGSVQTAPQPRLFPWTHSTPVPDGDTISSDPVDALNYLRAQLGVVTDQPAIVTLLQDTTNDFSDGTKCLITQATTEEQADGSFRILIVVDLAWRWVRGYIENDSGTDQTFMRAQMSLSGVR